jgi:hypothetical protein
MGSTHEATTDEADSKFATRAHRGRIPRDSSLCYSLGSGRLAPLLKAKNIEKGDLNGERFLNVTPEMIAQFFQSPNTPKNLWCR